jgi:hypothetical protein
MFGSNLARLAFCLDRRQTGDGYRLAPKGIPFVLDVVNRVMGVAVVPVLPRTN